jgi:hypothetical protein
MKTIIGTHLSKILKNVSGHLLSHFDEVLLNNNKNVGQNSRLFDIKTDGRYTSCTVCFKMHGPLPSKWVPQTEAVAIAVQKA